MHTLLCDWIYTRIHDFLDDEFHAAFIKLWSEIRPFVFNGAESEDNEEEVGIVLKQRLENLKKLTEAPPQTEFGVRIAYFGINFEFRNHQNLCSTSKH